MQKIHGLRQHCHRHLASNQNVGVEVLVLSQRATVNKRARQGQNLARVNEGEPMRQLSR